MQEDMEKSIIPKAYSSEKRDYRQPYFNRNEGFVPQNSTYSSRSGHGNSRIPCGRGTYGRSSQAKNPNWRVSKKLLKPEEDRLPNGPESGEQDDSEVLSELQDFELGFFYNDKYTGRIAKSVNLPRQFSKKAQRLYAQSKSNSAASWRDPTKFYNKELFMQANCQFVVREGPDFTAFMVDPDLLVDWDMIEEVRIPLNEPQCPICQYPPRVAKVAKCGHLYCHPCALQYIAYDNDMKSKKCAICAEHMYPHDLRSALPYFTRAFNEGDEINMVLMRRSKGHTQVFSAENVERRSSLTEYTPVRLREANRLTFFSKLLIASSSDVEDMIIKRELKELSELEFEAADDFDRLFLNQVRESIDSRLEILRNRVLASGAESAPSKRSSVSNLSEECLEEQIAEDALDPPRNSSESNRRAKTTSLCEEPAFYFYQCEDGQHIYLHSLNWQCLVKEFGSMENCPPTVRAKIVQIDRFSMNTVLRKRTPYLRHMPLTCAMSVVELDLKPPLISKDTLLAFSDRLLVRQKDRQAKARYERYLSKAKDREEKRMLGDDILYHTIPSAMLESLKVKEDPTFTDDDPPLPSSVAQPASSTESTTPKSFAQVMRHKSTAQWPTVNSPTAPQVTRDAPSAEASNRDIGDESAAPKIASMGDTLGALIDAQLLQVGKKRQKQAKNKKKQKQFFDDLAKTD